jgi:hypothetical protein
MRCIDTYSIRLSSIALSEVHRLTYVSGFWAGRSTAKSGGCPAPRAAACLVHCLLLQAVTSLWCTKRSGDPRPGQVTGQQAIYEGAPSFVTAVF